MAEVPTAETADSQRAVHLVAWIKFLTFNLIKDVGAALGKGYAHLPVPSVRTVQVATLARRYIRRPGRLYLHAGQLIVQLDPFRGDEALEPFIRQLNQRHLPIPWLSELILRVEFAAQPQGLAAIPNILGQNILANYSPAGPLFHYRTLSARGMSKATGMGRCSFRKCSSRRKPS